MKKLFGFLFILGSLLASSQENDISNPKVKWAFKAGGPVRSKVAIAGNKIFLASNDGVLYSLNETDGSLIWIFKTEGALCSEPTVSGNRVFVNSRDRHTYAVDTEAGTLQWKFKSDQALSDEGLGWDYFTASPVVHGDYVLSGAADGYLYAINQRSGKKLWKFKTNGRIRAASLVNDGMIYQPSNDGCIYIINSKDGSLAWKFETEGAHLNSADFGFDRNSIFTRPSVSNNTLVFGSRDGHVYAVDLVTHKEKWRFSYGPTWAQNVVVADNTVFVGWSTNNLACAIDLESGKEIWKYKCGAHVYNDILIDGDHAIFGSADGNLYALGKQSGDKTWVYPVGSEIYGSPVYQKGTLYIGTDEGFLYAIENGQKPFFAVYQPSVNKKSYPVLDPAVLPFLLDKGFEQLDSSNLRAFLEMRIKDEKPSVIVFAYDIMPEDIIGSNPAKGLVRQYLNKGGKIVWLGGIPNLYTPEANGNFRFDKTIGQKLLDVQFGAPRESGNYYSKASQEGLNMGLPLWFKTTNATVEGDGVVPLAIDEFGRISAWVKRFKKNVGSGFVSFRNWSFNIPVKTQELEILYRVAIYGLK